MSQKIWLCVAGGLAALTLSVAAGTVWVISKAVETAPSTPTAPALAASDLQSARSLLSRQTLKGAFRGRALNLTATSPQAQALLNDASMRLLQAPSSLTLHTNRADVAISLPLSSPRFTALQRWGSWLNVHATITTTSAHAPQLSQLRVGELTVPPALAIWMGRQVLRHQGVLEFAELGWSTLERVRLTPAHVQVTARWRPELSAQASDLLLPPDVLQALTDAHHDLVKLLMPTEDDSIAPAPLSLDDLLLPMLAQAQARTQAQAAASSPAQQATIAARENRAALLMLGLYINRVSLASLVPQAREWAPLSSRVITLHGRTDLAQHFLTSAAMATDLGGRLANLIGVYKELLDALPQGAGSGFSFNDLAADKAGVRLGRLAMNEPVQTQARMAQAQHEADFMPEVEDLPEFLSERVFRQRFGGLDAPAYERMVADIERRVAETPVLR